MSGKRKKVTELTEQVKELEHAAEQAAATKQQVESQLAHFCKTANEKREEQANASQEAAARLSELMSSLERHKEAELQALECLSNKQSQLTVLDESLQCKLRQLTELTVMSVSCEVLIRAFCMVCRCKHM